ncbi:hypothetical protein NDU88_006970 [Pleurodeles waltl]|uniref:Uncharacterized protein n=1 Tax=Pleurodeles waltl TaxID=8319 RepID=A0AAV7QMP0_PLEWA|nr:hypothetical protein NDU88_006970 [Pleurodeles waltl]
MEPKIAATRVTGFSCPYLDNKRIRTRSPCLRSRISRVPDGIKKEDGLRARSALRREDAKEEAEAERGAGAEKRPDHTEEAEQPEANPGDKPKGREGPEEPERRHVPGGTWLSQERSYLKESFRLTKGREEAEGDGEREEREEGMEDKKGRGKDFRRGM